MTPVRKTLSDLGLAPVRGQDRAVTGLCLDSRKITPGEVFAALPGSEIHGGRFIGQVLDAGAAAVLTDAAGAAMADEALQAHADVAVIVTEEPRAALARAAALWFGAQPRHIVAVTGTNGKTSVASFTRQIWARLGHKAVSIGTIGVEGAYSAPGIHTTPDPLTLHALLADIAAERIDHVAMEASSHGLDQRRMDGVVLAAAAFTNLSQDHLDYHGSMEAYLAAKLRLFSELLPEDGTAVVNVTEAAGRQAAEIAADRGLATISIGATAQADLSITGRRVFDTGQEVLFRHGHASYRARLELIGDFQAMNALQAAALAIAVGEPPEDVFAALPHLTGVRGRMELAARRRFGAPIYVDYSHTPASVEIALKALRPHVMGRLLVVLGAGGDRDRGKRPLMGKAAAENADLVFVTDDNPRSESPAMIRQAVLSGCPGALEIGDRAEAILRAVDALGPGDALLIAGKGHETGQTIGDVVYPFDDVEQASLAVAALEGAI